MSGVFTNRRAFQFGFSILLVFFALTIGIGIGIGIQHFYEDYDCPASTPGVAEWGSARTVGKLCNKPAELCHGTTMAPLAGASDGGAWIFCDILRDLMKRA